MLRDRLSTSNSGIVEERYPTLFLGRPKHVHYVSYSVSSELLAVGLREGALNAKMLSRYTFRLQSSPQSPQS